MKRTGLSVAIVLALLQPACNSSKDKTETPPSENGSIAAPQTQPSAKAADPASARMQLFNGKDLSGWRAVLDNPQVSMEEVWSVQDGVLACKGQPSGYIRTVRDDFENYLLTLEWRWPPGTAGGNNGVLVHASTPGELGIWPKSIEVQLKRDDAGDFWVIGTELDVENEESRKSGRRHLNLTDNSEKPMGEWNRIEITCRANEILVKVNDDLVNHATNCNVTKGAICLQSEGAPIEYRNIVLSPLP